MQHFFEVTYLIPLALALIALAAFVLSYHFENTRLLLKSRWVNYAERRNPYRL